MSEPLPHSDALVIFGVSGDLASKQIFPALQALVRSGAYATWVATSQRVTR